MEQTLDAFIAKVKELDKVLKSKGKTVSDKATRLKITELYRSWQDEIRPTLKTFPTDSTNIYEYDSLFDRLIGYSAKTTNTVLYRKEIKYILNNYLKHISNPWIKYSGILGKSNSEIIIDPINLPNLRSYLNEIIKQINITYSNLCAVACSLMLRKLVELMLYDYYEINKRESEIIDAQTKQYKNLKTIINMFINSSGEHLSNELKRLIQDIRIFGNTAAHNRRVLMIQPDIDKIKNTIEINIRELYNIVYR